MTTSEQAQEKIVKLKVPFTEREIKAIKYVAEVYDPATPDISSIIRNITLKIVNAGLQEISAKQAELRAKQDEETRADDSAGDVKEVSQSEAPVSDTVEGQEESNDTDGNGSEGTDKE